jgi:hypothetical protein
VQERRNLCAGIKADFQRFGPPRDPDGEHRQSRDRPARMPRESRDCISGHCTQWRRPARTIHAETSTRPSRDHRPIMRLPEPAARGAGAAAGEDPLESVRCVRSSYLVTSWSTRRAPPCARSSMDLRNGSRRRPQKRGDFFGRLQKLFGFVRFWAAYDAETSR